MKVNYMSDLHLEFGNMQLDNTENADVLILAGDIHTGTNAVDWINKVAAKYKDVIYILGNHEFYHHDMPELIAKLRDKTIFEPNVHFLNNSSIVIEGVKFAATTLWSNINAKSFYAMNDSRLINYAGMKMPLTKVKGMFWENQLFLDDNKDADVVITHHCPHIKSINTNRYPDDSMNSGYYTNILGNFEGSNIKHWVCGHTHSATEYTEYGINVHNNCRGYVGYGNGPDRCEVTQFNKAASFEVEPTSTPIQNMKDNLWK